MNAPVSIIIPAFNQEAYCRQCVASILRDPSVPFKLILVDNGSTDGVPAFFDSVPGATVVHLPENTGFAGGINAGLRHAEGHVLWLNSDTIVPKGWLTRLVNALESAPDIGMVGPMSNNVSSIQLIPDLEFQSEEEIDAYAAARAQSHAGRLRDVARLVGFCLLIRDTAFQQAGMLDESYGIGNFEDDDYCIKLIRLGFRLCVAEDAFVFHYGGRTFLGMGIIDQAWKELMARNERRFHEKWEPRPEERNDFLRQSRVFNQRARDAAAGGRIAEAFQCLRDAVAAAPQDARNFNDLGALLWQLGEREKARENFRRALTLDPGNAEAQQNLRDSEAAMQETPNPTEPSQP